MDAKAGLTGWKTFLGRFRRNEDGVTAIEFAMVGGPFLYLLLVIFETAIMLFSEYAIENGLAQAARQIRTGQVQTGTGNSKASFKTLVCSNIPAYLDCNTKLNIDVRSFPAFSNIAIPAALDAQGNLTAAVTTGSQFSAGTQLQVVVVRSYYAWDLVVPGISMLANMSGNQRLLTAGVVFRNEPYQ